MKHRKNGGFSMYKIMIVEDEAKIRDILKASIEKWGFQVHCAEDFEIYFRSFPKSSLNW